MIKEIAAMKLKERYDTKNIKEIIITNHAIDQYQNRVNYDTAREDAKTILVEITKQGIVTRFERSCTGKRKTNTIVYDLHKEYKGIGISAVVEGSRVTVVTCTGTAEYRKWYKHQNNIKYRRCA